MNLNAIITRYIAQQRSLGKLYRCEAFTLVAFGKFTGDIPVRDIRSDVILHFMNRIGARCAQIRMVPIKKKHITTSVTYLEKSEMDRLLAAPDQSSSQGRRDHALLLFLYHSGARVREVASLRIDDIDWHSKSGAWCGPIVITALCSIIMLPPDRDLDDHRPFLPCGGCLLRYAPGKILKGLLKQGNHLVTRVKSNAVTYLPIERKKGHRKRGRPSQRGCAGGLGSHPKAGSDVVCFLFLLSEPREFEGRGARRRSSKPRVRAGAFAYLANLLM